MKDSINYAIVRNINSEALCMETNMHKVAMQYKNKGIPVLEIFQLIASFLFSNIVVNSEELSKIIKDARRIWFEKIKPEEMNNELFCNYLKYLS